MTFNEAAKHKKQFLRDSSNFTKSNYFCLITPAQQEEYLKYLQDFKNSPGSFIDESCKLYSTDSDFKVVVIPRKEILTNMEEQAALNIL